MKKPLLLLALFFGILQIGQSQKVYFWLDVGLKADYGMGMHLNKNVIDNSSAEAKFGQSYGFGGKFGFNFADYHSFNIDGMYHYMKQENVVGSSILGDVDKELKYNSVDIYGTYRFTRNLNYIELGVKYSILSNMEEKVGSAAASDASKLYVENNLSPVLGMGFNIAGADAFTVLAGIRLWYGLQDFVSEEGKTINAFIFPADVMDYHETHPLFAEFVVEFNFGLGYYAKASCGKRPKFFSF